MLSDTRRCGRALRQLERVPGHKVLGIDSRPDYPGEWQVYAWCDDPARFYWVTNDNLFRETVRKGLVVGFTRGALDHK